MLNAKGPMTKESPNFEKRNGVLAYRGIGAVSGCSRPARLASLEKVGEVPTFTRGGGPTLRVRALPRANVLDPDGVVRVRAVRGVEFQAWRWEVCRALIGAYFKLAFLTALRMICHPVMDNDVKHTADFYRLVAWAHARRKQLYAIGGSIAVVIVIVASYVAIKNNHEATAALELSTLKPPLSAENVSASAADAYLKVANDYPGTGAGTRALLTAGGIYFDLNKFKEAQDLFERFMREYPDSMLANQALLGIAASLEAQGKLAEATSRYSDYLQRHGLDSTTPMAKSALGRLYVAQNKPDKALQYYTDLAQGGSPDSWSMEAGIQAEELLQKHPELRKPKAPAPGPAPGSAPPILNLPPK